MSELRQRAHEILDHTKPDDPPATLMSGALVVLITANVVAIVLKSEAGIDAVWHQWFGGFEVVSVALFTLEYLVRLWAAVESGHGRYRRPVLGRLRYMATPLALVDLIAILPFYLSFLIPVDLLFVRIFRMFLIFKLTRYQASMNLLAKVLRNEAGPIAAAIFVLMMLLVVAASFAYLAEHQAQPQVFASIPDAMWWAIVTMTTVGYGDMVPVTPLGKLVGGVIAIIGLGMVALPAGLLASGFSEQLHQRRQEFEAAVSRTLARGAITPEEGDELKEIRSRLGLTDHQAAEIVRLLAQRRAHARCPHCGGSLGPVAGPGAGRPSRPKPIRSDPEAGRGTRAERSGGLEADPRDLLDRARHGRLDLELGADLLEGLQLVPAQAAVGRDHIARDRIRGLAQLRRERLADQDEQPVPAAGLGQKLGAGGRDLRGRGPVHAPEDRQMVDQVADDPDLRVVDLVIRFGGRHHRVHQSFLRAQHRGLLPDLLTRLNHGGREVDVR